MSRDLRAEIGAAPLTSFQVGAIAVCVGLNMLDGFDILAMSFAASGVKADWGLLDTQLGMLLSAGLVGMGAGSLVLGPCADRFGRRPIVLLAASLGGLGMLGSCLARGFADLLVLRVITGFGIGGTIASVAVVVSEYSPDRLRRSALALYATGYSIGAALGGALATLAIPAYGWRAAFAIGGVMSLALLPIATWRLPESLDFLLTRRPASALARVNRMLAAMGREPIASLPVPPAATVATEPPRWTLLLTRRTLLAWVTFFCTMAGFYFIVSWTPRLLHDAGLSSAQGMTGGVLLNIGGIVGCASYAAAAARLDAHRLLAGSLLATTLLLAALGHALGSLGVALVTGLLLGVAANAAMAGLYAVGPPLYPTQVRATGMGLAIGIGRFGAILAPIASGALLERGWSGSDLYVLFIVPYALAAIAMLALGPVGNRIRAGENVGKPRSPA